MRTVVILLLALLCVACQTSQPVAPPTNSVPAWANFMELEEYRAFLSAVEGHFEQKQRKVLINDGFISFPEEPGSAKFGLLNLAQVCHQEEPSEWAKVIDQHFAIIEQTPLTATPVSLEEVQDHILLRIVSPDYAKVTGDSLYREDIPDTLSLIVVDTPQSVRSVSLKEAKQWGLSRTQLFDLGLKNLKKLVFSEAEQIELHDGMNLTVVADDSFFTASLALNLRAHPEWLGQHGSLVGIPTRHMLLIYPIENKDVLTVIQLLPNLLTNLEQEGPGSVTSALYHYNGQTFELVPYASVDGSFELSPPPELSKALIKVSKP